jgi:type IV secretory pathway VirB10-like protein
MKVHHIVCTAAVGGIVLLALLTGCKSKEQTALDQAKSQAITTNVPQQVQFIDGKGNTVTETVQPPATVGAQPLVTVNTAPPAPGPVPAETNPVITPLATNGITYTPGPATTQNTASTGTPASTQASFTVPAGTELSIRINEHISVKHSHAGDHFSGEIVEPVTTGNSVLIPRGTPVSGRIDESHRRGHFKGRSVLELRLTTLTLNGVAYPLDTHDNVRTKKGKGKRTAGFIGGMTGAGMLIGGLATGGVGLAIGGAAGAGAGTLIAGTTGNRDIEIPAESVMRFRLSDPLVLQTP